MSSKTGQSTFNFALRVPADKIETVEELLAAHATWMRETHSLEYDGKIHLIDFHWAKSEELKNPIDPSEGTTGNMLYALTEVYPDKDGPSQHMDAAMKWDGFQPLAGMILEHSEVMLMSGTIIHSMD